jgi:DNA-binding NarL/FixJ family response regulator
MPLSTADQYGFNCGRSSIVIVDRFLLLRSCLARVLRHEFQSFGVLDIATTQELEYLLGPIGLVVLNIESDALTAELVREKLTSLRRALADVPIVLITQWDASTISDSMVSEVARSGVRGYVTGNAPIELILSCLRLVMGGGVHFPQSTTGGGEACIANAPVLPDNSGALQLPAGDETGELASCTDRSRVAFTERERQVLASLQRGLPNKVIAKNLNLSENTIKVHISNIMRKLNATNRTEVALAAQGNMMEDFRSAPSDHSPVVSLVRPRMN